MPGADGFMPSTMIQVMTSEDSRLRSQDFRPTLATNEFFGKDSGAVLTSDERFMQLRQRANLLSFDNDVLRRENSALRILCSLLCNMKTHWTPTTAMHNMSSRRAHIGSPLLGNLHRDHLCTTANASIDQNKCSGKFGLSNRTPVIEHSSHAPVTESIHSTRTRVAFENFHSTHGMFDPLPNCRHKGRSSSCETFLTPRIATNYYRVLPRSWRVSSEVARQISDVLGSFGGLLSLDTKFPTIHNQREGFAQSFASSLPRRCRSAGFVPVKYCDTSQSQSDKLETKPRTRARMQAQGVLRDGRRYHKSSSAIRAIEQRIHGTSLRADFVGSDHKVQPYYRSLSNGTEARIGSTEYSSDPYSRHKLPPRNQRSARSLGSDGQTHKMVNTPATNRKYTRSVSSTCGHCIDQYASHAFDSPGTTQDQESIRRSKPLKERIFGAFSVGEKKESDVKNSPSKRRHSSPWTFFQPITALLSSYEKANQESVENPIVNALPHLQTSNVATQTINAGPSDTVPIQGLRSSPLHSCSQRVWANSSGASGIILNTSYRNQSKQNRLPTGSSIFSADRTDLDESETPPNVAGCLQKELSRPFESWGEKTILSLKVGMPKTISDVDTLERKNETGSEDARGPLHWRPSRKADAVPLHLPIGTLYPVSFEEEDIWVRCKTNANNTCSPSGARKSQDQKGQSRGANLSPGDSYVCKEDSNAIFPGAGSLSEANLTNERKKIPDSDLSTHGDEFTEFIPDHDMTAMEMDDHGEAKMKQSQDERKKKATKTIRNSIRALFGFMKISNSEKNLTKEQNADLTRPDEQVLQNEVKIGPASPSNPETNLQSLTDSNNDEQGEPTFTPNGPFFEGFSSTFEHFVESGEKILPSVHRLASTHGFSPSTLPIHVDIPTKNAQRPLLAPMVASYSEVQSRTMSSLVPTGSFDQATFRQWKREGKTGHRHNRSGLSMVMFSSPRGHDWNAFQEMQKQLQILNPSGRHRLSTSYPRDLSAVLQALPSRSNGLRPADRKGEHPSLALQSDMANLYARSSGYTFTMMMNILKKYQSGITGILLPTMEGGAVNASGNVTPSTSKRLSKELEQAVKDLTREPSIVLNGSPFQLGNDSLLQQFFGELANTIRREFMTDESIQSYFADWKQVLREKLYIEAGLWRHKKREISASGSTTNRFATKNDFFFDAENVKRPTSVESIEMFAGIAQSEQEQDDTLSDNEDLIIHGDIDEDIEDKVTMELSRHLEGLVASAVCDIAISCSRTVTGGDSFAVACSLLCPPAYEMLLGSNTTHPTSHASRFSAVHSLFSPNPAIYHPYSNCHKGHSPSSHSPSSIARRKHSGKTDEKSSTRVYIAQDGDKEANIRSERDAVNTAPSVDGNDWYCKQKARQSFLTSESASQIPIEITVRANSVTIASVNAYRICSMVLANSANELDEWVNVPSPSNPTPSSTRNTHSLSIYRDNVSDLLQMPVAIPIDSRAARSTVHDKHETHCSFNDLHYHASGTDNEDYTGSDKEIEEPIHNRSSQSRASDATVVDQDVSSHLPLHRSILHLSRLSHMSHTSNASSVVEIEHSADRRYLRSVQDVDSPSTNSSRYISPLASPIISPAMSPKDRKKQLVDEDSEEEEIQVWSLARCVLHEEIVFGIPDVLKQVSNFPKNSRIEGTYISSSRICSSLSSGRENIVSTAGNLPCVHAQKNHPSNHLHSVRPSTSGRMPNRIGKDASRDQVSEVSTASSMQRKMNFRGSESYWGQNMDHSRLDQEWELEERNTKRRLPQLSSFELDDMIHKVEARTSQTRNDVADITEDHNTHDLDEEEQRLRYVATAKGNSASRVQLTAFIRNKCIRWMDMDFALFPEPQ